MPLKLKLTLNIFLFLFCTTTNTFAVVGHPVSENPALSKKEKRKLKRQQKLLNFVEKVQGNKLGEYTELFEMLADSTSCDTIVFNNGKTITATIFEITNDGIQYIRCNQANAMKVRLSQRAVKEVRYHNGDVKDLSAFQGPSASSSPIPEGVAYHDSQMKDAKTIGIVVGILCGASSLLGLIGMLILYLVYQGKERNIRRQAMKHAWIAFGAVILALLLLLIISFALSF